MTDKIKHLGNGKKEQRCMSRCGWCCTFFILKTKNLDAVVKSKKGQSVLVTEKYNLNKDFFNYHNCKMGTDKNKKSLVFVFDTPKEEIKVKVVGEEKIFMIPIKCKHLKNLRCRIYRSRPLACKVNGCPKGDEFYEKW